MSTVEIMAIILGGLTIGSALMVVVSPHPIRSVLFLVVTFFLISANYVMLNAQFLAIVNVIVYTGAIMVLFLFVLMLLNLSKDNEPKTSGLMKIGAAVAGGSLFVVLFAALKDATFGAIEHSDNSIGLVEQLGLLLFNKYVLPFEISSILFISAMVGAVLLSKKENQVID